MIKLGNKRNGDTGQYVGRPTALGNPFPVNNARTRDQACDAYQEWFEHKLKEGLDTEFHRQLNMLINIYETTGELTLICWCHPLRCHTKTIRNWILSVTEGDNHD